MPAALKNRDELLDQVFSLVENGKSLNQACKIAGVALPTVLGWCDSDEATSERYARARASLIEGQVRELYRIADAANADTVQEAKLQIDVRKWALSKLMPKKFGDRQVIDMSVSQTISIRDALAQAERRVIDVVAKPVLAPPDGIDDAS